MNNSLNMLMTRSHIDKKKHISKIDLNEMLSSELDFYNSDLTFRNKVNKEIDLSEGELFIEVIPSEIIQVFQNRLVLRSGVGHKLQNGQGSGIGILIAD